MSTPVAKILKFTICGPKDRNYFYSCYTEIRLRIDTAVSDLAVLFILAKMLWPKQEGPCSKCYIVVFFIANSFSA